ncbi:MAG: hypothetical protein WCA82_00655, partial [Jiangellales bacterium]
MTFLVETVDASSSLWSRPGLGSACPQVVTGVAPVRPRLDLGSAAAVTADEARCLFGGDALLDHGGQPRP